MMSATTIRGGIAIVVRRRHLFFSTSHRHRPRLRHPPTPNDGGRKNDNNSNSNNNNRSKNKDLFTPSPFKHGSCKININEDYSVIRYLLDNNTKDVYGMRRYLLLPQSSLSSSYDSHTSNSQTEEEVATLEKKAIASINANANVLFGARLHYHNDSYIRGIGSLLPTSNDVESYSDNTQYFFACGTLLDIAKEDASINGQQVQALAALDGLCHWVRTCLSNNGEGSTVLTGLIHGYNNYVDDNYSVSSATTTCLKGDEAKTNNKNSLKKVTTPTTTTSPRSGKRSVSIIIESSSLGNNNENQRQKILEAITAIATGKPRKGHSIIGAGTYRDGMIGWIALSREYAQLSSSSNAALTEAATLNEHKEVDDDYKNTITNPTFFSEEVKGGSFEISLYKSRNGEVTKIEHLACTTPEYLIEAGGAMARIFFV